MQSQSFEIEQKYTKFQYVLNRYYFWSIRFDGGPISSEPKFIVFYTQLCAIFSMFCFKCKAANPTTLMRRNGTMVTVVQECNSCGRDPFTWRSQPLVLGKYPAGNILLSFAVLMAGASISKVVLVFKHMGLSLYNIRTYFRHQAKLIFPAVLSYWELYQTKLLDGLRSTKNAVWSGDGRFDSMGHSAKFGVYTMFNCNVMKVVHFELLQVDTCHYICL